MKHTLPTLNYAYDALEPFIDAQTMEIHYSKHHQTYVNNLAKALEGNSELLNKELEEILQNLNTLPDNLKTVVRNNAGGVYNHSLFWTYMTPLENERSGISTDLLTHIETKFTSLDNFKAEFAKAALARFGSGWAWLVVNKNKDLEIVSTANQDTPISDGNTPILGIDVWEHAYYLKYQNKRAEYIDKWWNVVNWQAVSNYYSKVK